MADPLDTIINPPISAIRFIAMVLYANRGCRCTLGAEEILDDLRRRHTRFQHTAWDLTMMRFAVFELREILGRAIVIYDLHRGTRWSSPHVQGRSPVFIYVNSEGSPKDHRRVTE